MSAMVHRSANGNRASVGGGRVLMWQGGSLWVSRATGRTQPHAHHAIQITLAPDHPVRLRGAGSIDWRQERASIVMPHRPHQFDGDGRDVAMVFVEPETAAGRRLLARYGDGGDVQGVLCVLGPTRMAYWRAVAMVRFIADLLDLLVADALADSGSAPAGPPGGAGAVPTPADEPGA